MVPDTAAGCEYRADVLSWTLPAILQEIETETGPAFVWDLIDTFEADTTEHFDLACTAAADDDRQALRQQCHRLKGSSRQMGATVLGALYEHIECGCEDTNMAELKDSLGRASAEFLRVSRQMRTYSGPRGVSSSETEVV